MMNTKKLWTLLAAVVIGAVMLGACAPKGVTPLPEPTSVPQVRERVARETVIVEKEIVVHKEVEVTRIVEGQPRAMERQVEVEKVVTATPLTGGVPVYGGETLPNDEPYDSMFFKHYGTNPFIDTEDDHLSTFAMDVDTASYSVARRYVNEGQLPPEDAIRVEEFVNYFPQSYPGPKKGEGAFAIHLEGAPSPFGGENHYLVRVGIQGKRVEAEERKDAVLTFVIDVSGSMDRENRLGLVKRALRLLVDELRPTDQVAIVVYGSNARTALQPTFADQRSRILNAIDRLRPDGSTYAEAGLREGYRMANRAFQPGAINRLILCSDGVANVGRTGAESILEVIGEYAGRDITLSTVGFGLGNYNDVLMEQLADKGNGNYAYVDTLDEARRIFVENLTGTLQVIAQDSKIQVDFDPNVVSRYRLLGYENRDVADKDFRNDSVDAGEVGAGHSVTALYEVKFHKGIEADELARALVVHVRYQDPDDLRVREVAREFWRDEFQASFEGATPMFRLTAAVAEYAELLRGSYWAQEGSLDDVLVVARMAGADLAMDDRMEHESSLSNDVSEFIWLVSQARRVAERG